MHNHYGNQGLPIPADQIFQQNMVNELPPLPRVDIGSVDMNTASQIHSGLINAIQRSATASAVRVFMFNMMSDNRYNNPQYTELYLATIEYFMYLCQARASNPMEIAVENSVLAEIANLIARYPALESYITPDQIPFVNDYIRIRNEIVNVMRQYTQQNQQMSQPQFNNNLGHGMSNTVRSGIGMGNRLTSPIQNNQIRNRPQGGGRSPQASMLSNPQGGPSSNIQSNNTKPMVNRSIQSNTTTMGMKYNKADKNMIRIEDEDRSLSHHISMDDEIVSPFLEPIDKHIEFSNLNYPLAFRSDQRLIVEVEDGVTKYGLCDNEENTMDYVDHELDHNLIRIAKTNTNGPVINKPSVWQEVTAPNVISESDIKNVSDDEPLNIGVNEPIVLNKFIEAYSISQAYMLANEELDSLNLNPTEPRMLEYYVKLKTPIICTDHDVELIHDVLLEANDLTDLVDKLIALGNNEDQHLSPKVWHLIHDRLTNVLKRRLNAGISSGIDIDTLTGDYEDAMEAVGEDFTNTAIDRFKRNTFITMLKTISMIFDETEKSFVEPISVTHLPWSSTEIDLNLKEEYSMLSKGVSQDMYTSVVRLFNRTNVSELSVNRRFMITLDNVWIEIHHGDIGNDTILLSKVECKS